MKYLIRALIALVVVAIAVALGLYQLLSRSLPELDGEFTVAGVTAPVTVERDAKGIATIRGKTRADVAFASGYVHAQDRFFQMDLSRRVAAGELSELFGPAALDVDKRNRLHRFRARAAVALQERSAQDLAVIDAYTSGVNAGLASIGGKPFEYELLRVEPRSWTRADVILVGYSMFMVLNDQQATEDIRRGMVHDALPQEMYDWLYQPGTPWDAPMEGEATPAVPMPGPDVIDLSGQQPVASLQVHEDRQMPGSNNWAISGSLTKSGRAIVANDMHLGIRVPNTFYRARFIVEGESDTNGVSLPGTPVIVSGSNGRIAWGFTNSNGDWSDAVSITRTEDSSGYLTPDGPQSFETFEEIIQVKDADNVTFQVEQTIWGPVVQQHGYDGREFAARWIAHDRSAMNIDHLQLEKAGSVSEALTIANRLGMPPQNFVVGDADGNIAWTMTGRIPVRADVDSTIPVDGTEATDWSGWLPPEEYPRIVNPESGRIWTANARVVEGENLRKVGDGGYDIGARSRQIRDGLLDRETLEVADMLAIQVDDRALFLARWQELLLELLDDDAVAGNAERQQYRDLVENWVPRAAPESVGYRLVREYRFAVRDTVFDMLTTPVRQQVGESARLLISNQFEAPLWQAINEQPAHLLTADYESWDALLLAVVDEELARYRDSYPDGLENRSWGERNTARIRHPISSSVNFLSEWLDMPADPLGGDSNLPKAMGPAFGASERFGVEPGDERNAYLHMPTGASGHPMSDFYGLGHDDWVHDRPTPFLPGDAAHTLVLSPSE